MNLGGARACYLLTLFITTAPGCGDGGPSLPGTGGSGAAPSGGGLASGGAGATAGLATGGSSGATGGSSGATGGSSGATGGSSGATGGSSGATGGSSGATGGSLGATGGDGGAVAGGMGGAGNAGDGGAGAEGGSAGTSGDWKGCPDAADYQGDLSWAQTIEVTPGATYCAKFDESRTTMKEELQKKALLRIAPGTYPLPNGTRSGLGLPVCVKFGEKEAPAAVIPVSNSYLASQSSSLTSHRHTFVETLPNPDRKLSVDVYVTLPTGQTPHMTIDGGAPSPFDEAVPRATFVLCNSLEQNCQLDRVFDSCTHQSSRLNRHDVVLDAGAISFELRIGQSAASTEPAAFVRASGSFRGQSFDQRSYWKLIYHPAHHHVERAFAVLFDAPIDGACGIEVSRLEPFEDQVPDEAYAIDCALDHREALSVVSHTLTREP